MQFNKFTNHWKKLYKEFFNSQKLDQRALNNLQKTNRTISLIQNIFQLVASENITIKDAIIKLNLWNEKSKLYSYIKKIEEIKTKEEVSTILVKNTGPKEIKYIYNNKIRKWIADKHYLEYINAVNVWFVTRKHFNINISLKTINKIINNDPRCKKTKKKPEIKHKARFYNIPFGNIQMDLKIIGPKESPTGKRITIYDAKDEQSKLYYMEVVPDASTNNLLQATKNMIHYFKKIGLNINRIRTDNAMVFKQNNFVRSFPYDELLKQHNIKNEKIPLRQPECNGVIERQHQILDQEFKPLINVFDNVDTLNKKAKKFMKNFNYDRYHYYHFLSKTSDFRKQENRFFIPFEFFNSFKNLN